MSKRWLAVATLLALAGCDSYVSAPAMLDAISGVWHYSAAEVRSGNDEGACDLPGMTVRMTQDGPKLLGDTDPAPMVCETAGGPVTSTFPASVFSGELVGDSVRFAIGDLYCEGRIVSAHRMEGAVIGYGRSEDGYAEASGTFVLVRATP